MGLTPHDLQALLEAFEASSWQEMTVEVDLTRLHVSRRAEPAATPTPTSAPSAAEPSAITNGHQATPAGTEVAAPGGGDADATTIPAPVPTAPGAPVIAPSVGVFWRAPSPGAPPFVEIGARVGADDTIGILEIMKLMKAIPAGVAGAVTAILVDNGASVEYGQPLVLVDPDG
jgi:acetyl-CoA carboxylase biotin carboxyl carrier protein